MLDKYSIRNCSSSFLFWFIHTISQKVINKVIKNKNFIKNFRSKESLDSDLPLKMEQVPLEDLS